MVKTEKWGSERKSVFIGVMKAENWREEHEKCVHRCDENRNLTREAIKVCSSVWWKQKFDERSEKSVFIGIMKTEKRQMKRKKCVHRCDENRNLTREAKKVRSSVWWKQKFDERSTKSVFIGIMKTDKRREKWKKCVHRHDENRNLTREAKKVCSSDWKQKLPEQLGKSVVIKVQWEK